MNYATPEKMGIRSSYIQEYVESLEKASLSTHDIIIMRGDNIVFEKYYAPFHKDFLHRMYSVTKSFVALAVGFSEQDGLINLDEPILQYFPEELKNQDDENMKKQTVRHMLMMATAKPDRGWFSLRPDDRVKCYFENDLKQSRPSGTIFSYDSGGSFVLGALVEKITGKTLTDYLRDKLFDKIGVSKEAYMLKCPGGHSWGDSGLLCTASDLLKVARFCLNGGSWKGEQILNKEFMEKATTKQIDSREQGVGNFDEQGYGYQFWMCYGNSFFFNGMGCQLALCIPEKDLILVYNGDNQGNVFAKKQIIDGFFELVVNKTLDTEIRENPTEQENLNEYAASLKLFAVRGEKHCSIEKEVNGVTYQMSPNPMGITRMKLEIRENSGILYYTNAQGDKELPFGLCCNEISLFPQEGYSDLIGSQKGNRLYRCASSGAWVSEKEFFIKVQVIDTYFGNLNIHFGFREDSKVGIFMSKTAEDFLNEYQGFAEGKH